MQILCWLAIVATLAAAVKASLSETEVLSESERKEMKIEYSKPLQLNIVDMHGAPTLNVNTGQKTLGVEYSGSQFKITASDIPLLTFDNKYLDAKNLVYEVQDPVIHGEYKSYSYDVWKMISTDNEFKKLDKTKLVMCGNILYYGGACKLSKVAR